ncbi:hypothetical protein AB0G73_33615 [Streptomyces sp. NPDC020719]|uniref:hypothetical protein n=1 Tax=Streptomyces sp. NPDC020719 TaxID=3154896 RepID=UPI0033C50BD4
MFTCASIRAAVAPWPGPGRLPGGDLLLEGEILVWVAGGYLSGIEYAWFGDAMPTRLPSADRITIEVE